MDTGLIAATVLLALLSLDLLALRFGARSRDGRRETWW